LTAILIESGGAVVVRRAYHAAAMAKIRSLLGLGGRMLVWAAMSAGAPVGAQTVQALTEEWPPFNYLEGDKPAGYAVDVARCVFERSHVSYTMAVYPWARAYETAQHAPNTMLFTIARTPDREELFRWIGPIAPRNVYLFKLKRRTDIRVESLGDVRRYVVGVSRNDASEQYLRSQGFSEGTNLDFAPRGITQLRKLEAGRIDFVTGTELSTAYYARSNGIDPGAIERSLLLVSQGGYYLAVSRSTDATLFDRLARGFDECQRNDNLTRLMQPYLAPATK